MGYPTYNTSTAREASMSYQTKTFTETFQQSKERVIHPLMDPKDITLRECRDSENHPESLPIIITLDVTGSMRQVPKDFIDQEMVHIMSRLLQEGIQSPQVLFIAIGDETCDDAPLQIGQFEAGDAEINMWLERVWPEGGGGGNKGESYNLAWYFAGNHTVHDHGIKRGKKGLLITIGDEPVLDIITKNWLSKNNFGAQSDVTTAQAVEDAKKLYELKHIHVNHASNRSTNIGSFIGAQNVHNVVFTKEIGDTIVDLVLKHVGVPQTTTTQPPKIL